MNETIQDHASLNGIDLPSGLTLDGSIHRFSTGKKHKKNGWYVGFNNTGIVRYGDWSTSTSHSYYPRGKDERTAEEKQQTEELIKKEREIRETEQAAGETAAKFTAISIMDYSANRVDNGYLEKKKVMDKRLNFYSAMCPDTNRRVLAVPMTDEHGAIHNVQKIYPDGFKKFLSGGRTRGLFHRLERISTKDKNIYIVEGFATGLTIQMATEAEVICAMSAGNIKEVIHSFPTAIICGEIDADKAFEKATKNIQNKIIMPRLTDGSDFNDLLVSDGLDEVKKQLFENKKESATQKSDRRVLAKLYEEIAEKIDLEELSDKYHVIEPEPGVRKLLKVGNRRVVRYVVDDALATSILKFSQGYPHYQFTFKNAREAATYWMHTIKPINEPPMVAMKSDDTLCFHRLPFDPDDGPDGNCPLFDEILGRSSDEKALIAFIGSLFIPKADRQQYLWLYGQGMNGKGALIRFLTRCLGPSVFSTEPPVRDDKFWTHRLLGKRLVVFPDCSDYSFPASQKFKMLSGGDPIPIEAKGKQAFNTQLSCKFMFASNEKPSISGQKSDMRRAIFIDMAPIAGSIDPDYEEKLWAEAPAILGGCIDQYYNWCPSHVPIRTDTEELINVVEEEQSKYMDIFNKHFELDQRVGLQDIDRYKFNSNEMNALCKDYKMSKKEAKEFKKFLEYRFGIKYKQFKIDKNILPRSYIGAFMRDSFLQDTAVNPTIKRN